MSYELYFIGGPMDLTKQIKEGDSPRYGYIKVPEFLPIYPYQEDNLQGPTPYYHEYRIYPLPKQRHYDRDRTYVAIHEGHSR